jgi:1-acyl-sn-glycerol-3-phosphate acyltransferase
MLRRIYSAAFWAFLLGSSAVLFFVAALVWAVTAPFDRRKVALHRFTCWWASLYTRINPLWPVTVVGRERIRDDRAAMIVANHLSFLDILVLFRLSRHFKWVSKVENFRVPFVGWNMWLNGYIPLRRGDRQSVLAMLERCRRTLAAGSSVMMFPEGTRSQDGQMRPFKPGAFSLAIELQVPLIPIALEGTSDALPKRGFILRGRHPITVTVLEPIEPEEFGDRDASALADHVRDLIGAHLSR